MVRRDRGLDRHPAVERRAVAVEQDDRRARAELAIADVDAVDIDERRVGRRTGQRPRVKAGTTGERDECCDGEDPTEHQGMSLRTSASLLNSAVVSLSCEVALATVPKHSAVQAYDRTVR